MNKYPLVFVAALLGICLLTTPARAIDQAEYQKTLATAKALLAEEKDEQAFNLYREKIRTQPKEPLWHAQLGKTISLVAAMYYKGKPVQQKKYYDESEQHYLEAIKLYDPVKDKLMIAQCHYDIGTIYEFIRKDAEKAANLYLKALELDPQHKYAIDGLKRIRQADIQMASK